MMIGPYALPAAFEREELASLLMELTPRQRRVLREYVDRVELGALSITEWFADPKCPVSQRAWYTTGETAAYRHSPVFQVALQAYLKAALAAAEAETVRAIAASRRILRLGAVAAANRLVLETDRGERSADRIKAAAEVLNRADMETAAKSEVEVSDAREKLARLLGADDDAGAETAGAGEAE